MNNTEKPTKGGESETITYDIPKGKTQVGILLSDGTVIPHIGVSKSKGNADSNHRNGEKPSVA